MKWHDFEIRSINNDNQYELLHWHDDCCITIAFISYSEEMEWFDISSIGTRLIEFWEEHLDEYILRYIKLLSLQYEYD